MGASESQKCGRFSATFRSTFSRTRTSRQSLKCEFLFIFNISVLLINLRENPPEELKLWMSTAKDPPDLVDLMRFYFLVRSIILAFINL